MSEVISADLIQWWHFTALALLLLASGLASMSETVMMAANRYRLQARAAKGERGATLALALIANTDRLLGVILLANNIVNVSAATLASFITIALFGSDERALAVGSFLLTFIILVFSEITPKVIGARHADWLAPWFAFPLTLLLKISGPVVDFVNLFVKGLLRLMQLHDAGSNHALHSADELRAMLKSAQWRFQNQQELLLNSLELEHLTVADVMVPRRAIEAIDLNQPESVIREQIATAYHTRLPLIDSRSDEILGILHNRRLVAKLLAGEPFNKALLLQAATTPYFIPGNTPLLAQLAEFQQRQQRLALVVDEYGELRGLITLDDILEEIIGQFTLTPTLTLTWDHQGTVTLPAEITIRDINRALGTTLPVDRGRTLNGLLLSTLQTLPEGETAVRFGSVVAEILQTDNRSIRVVRLRRLTDSLKQP